MSVKPLTRRKIHIPILIEVYQRQTVHLRPRLIDQMPLPQTISALLIPEQPIFVSAAGNDVVEPVSVNVIDQNLRRMITLALFETAQLQRMLFPLSLANIGRRLEPSVGSNNIRSPVSVDITYTPAEVHLLPADDMAHQVGFALALAYLVPLRILCMSQNLQGLAVTVNVNQVTRLEVSIDLADRQRPVTASLAHIAIPVDTLAEPSTSRNIIQPVTIHIQRRIEKIVVIPLTLVIHHVCLALRIELFLDRAKPMSLPRGILVPE